MRELSVRIKFTKHCLGNVKKLRHDETSGKKQTYFVLPRTPDGHIVFLPTWWQANMRFAADVLCRHQDKVSEILFDMLVDGKPKPIPSNLFRRWYGRNLFAFHEAFYPGQEVGVNAIVPDEVSDDDFRRLLDLAGRFKGISPARPGEFGLFTVESVRARTMADEETRTESPANQKVSHETITK